MYLPAAQYLRINQSVRTRNWWTFTTVWHMHLHTPIFCSFLGGKDEKKEKENDIIWWDSLFVACCPWCLFFFWVKGKLALLLWLLEFFFYVFVKSSIASFSPKFTSRGVLNGSAYFPLHFYPFCVASTNSWSGVTSLTMRIILLFMWRCVLLGLL